MTSCHGLNTVISAVVTKAHVLGCVTHRLVYSVIMVSFLVGRALHLTPIFVFRGRVLAQTLLAAASKRYLSQEKLPISRFPVPIMDTLPKDIQERMREVQEKVR